MSESEEKDSDRVLREDADDLACLKDPEEDAAGDEEDKNQLQDGTKDKDDVLSAENNVNDDFAHAIDVLSAAEAPSSPISKKHGRSDSPTPVVLAPPEDPALVDATANPTGGELQQPLAGGLMLIHDGPPLDGIAGGWPAGWRQRIVFRKTGGRKGPRKDNYFYTPVKGYELLGIKKAKLFIIKLKEFEGDEDKALESMTAPLV